jgi:hypothetical protein
VNRKDSEKTEETGDLVSINPYKIKMMLGEELIQIG